MQFIRTDIPGALYIFPVGTIGIYPGQGMRQLVNSKPVGEPFRRVAVKCRIYGFGSAAISGPQHEQVVDSWKQQPQIISIIFSPKKYF